MKFIHTADWQIGMKAVHVGEAGDRVREQRIKSVSKIIDLATENTVDFILVSGDVFEDNAVDRFSVQRIADILSGAKIPVYLIPGNHDPFVPGSVWEHPAWKVAGNIHVLTESKPVEIPGGTLYPCPVVERYSRRDPTSWIKIVAGEGIRVGVAHGTVEGIHQDEPDHPIARDAVKRGQLDYLALGHWHSTTLYEDAHGHVRMAYSGTHETTKFGERDSGNILLVEIPSREAPPSVTVIKTGTLTWKTMEIEVRAPGELTAFRNTIEKIDDPESTLADVKLSGVLFLDERDELLHIEDILASRFLYGRLDISGMIPSPDDDTWITNLPPGIIRETAIVLKNYCDPNFAGERPPWLSQQVATRALFEFYALASGVLK